MLKHREEHEHKNRLMWSWVLFKGDGISRPLLYTTSISPEYSVLVPKGCLTTWRFHITNSCQCHSFTSLFSVSSFLQTGLWSWTGFPCSFKFKCVTSPCSHIACVSLCACLSAFSSQIIPHTQPAGSVLTHKGSSLRASPPTGITCFHPPTPHLFSSPLPSCGALKITWLHLAEPVLLINKRSSSERRFNQPNQLTGEMCRTYSWRCVWQSGRAHEEGVGLRASWPYSAAQRCFWPWAACWLLSSFRPWGPFSCGGPKCAGPARLQHWSESGPACWNSAACLTAHPAPEHSSKSNMSRTVCDIYLDTAPHVCLSLKHPGLLY